MEAVFKALADKSRRRLLDVLFGKNGRTLNELCGYLSMSRQAVTKHLLLLERANLITVVWSGREKLHYLNPVPIHQIYDRWISKYDRHRIEALGELKNNLEAKRKPKGARTGGAV
ncbi:MAG TPA: helix-turn-helix domain-containing protein [Candidatus Dormibacteraeota bacterium]|jgi:DNA-binding transcriptional ArsR family regulator|nr:helix-turn-helix domain-containing protein [Candidatus Dormibacteraeota bacterium]